MDNSRTGMHGFCSKTGTSIWNENLDVNNFLRFYPQVQWSVHFNSLK